MLLPGTGEVGSSIFDPFTIVSGGVAWYNNQTGARTRAYEILPQNTSASTFGKAAGLGDVEAFCYQPPTEIGNRVWNDQNEDGIQDPGETSTGRCDSGVVPGEYAHRHRSDRRRWELHIQFSAGDFDPQPSI